MQTLPLLLFVASLQLGVERPLAPLSIGSAVGPCSPNAAVSVGSERAVIWTDFSSYPRTYLTWLDAENRNIGTPTLLGVSDDYYYVNRVTAAASDGTNVALARSPAAFTSVWHIDLLHRDGSVTPNTYTTSDPIVQIVSNGHGYLVRESTKITPLDETGQVTGQPLITAGGSPKIIVAGGRYLSIGNDIFGVGARYLDERSMTLGDRIHVAARGPDAVLQGVAGSRRGFAVLWGEQNASGADLWLTEYDVNGQITTPARLVASHERSGSVAASGSGYAVVADNGAFGFDLFTFDGEGRVRRPGPASRSNLTSVIVCDGDPALIVWAQSSQVYAMTPLSVHWRLAAETAISLREREQFWPRMLEMNGRTYVAWMERDDYDVLFAGVLNADRTALDGPPVRIATTRRRLQNPFLATDGSHLFLTWGEQDGHVGIALIAGDLRVVEQRSITVSQTYDAPMAVVWDGTALNIITTPGDVHRFNASLAQLDTTSLNVMGIDFDHASVEWTGSEYLFAYTRSYTPPNQNPTRALGFARMPRLDFDPHTTIEHDSVVRTNNVTPAIAASPGGVLLAGNDQSLLYDGTRERWLDSTAPSRQPHVLWNPAGWFLLTNGSSVLRIDNAGKVYGTTTLGEDVTESLAIEHGSQGTLLYTRSGRIYLRSMQ